MLDVVLVGWCLIRGIRWIGAYRAAATVAPAPGRLAYVLPGAECVARYGYAEQPLSCLERGYTDEGGKLVVNQRGFLGPEIDVPKPPGVLRLVCLGGSTSLGWPGALASLLQGAAVAGRHFEVVNAAVPGYGTDDLRIRYFSDVVPTEPDAVLIYTEWLDFGGCRAFRDDEIRLLTDLAQTGDFSQLARIPDAWFRTHVPDLLRPRAAEAELGRHAPSAFGRGFVPGRIADNLRAILKDASARGTRVGLVIPPHGLGCAPLPPPRCGDGLQLVDDDVSAFLEQSLPSLLRELADEFKAFTVPAAEVFRVDPHRCELMGGDAIHPSWAGAQRIADVVAGALYATFGR